MPVQSRSKAKIRQNLDQPTAPAVKNRPMEAAIPPRPAVTRLAASRPEMCRRLRFSNDETEQILALVANHMRFKDATEMRSATLKRFVRLPRFEEHLELHRLDCLSSHRHLEAYEFVRRFVAETPPQQVHPPRLVTGDDLKERGLAPGPQYAEILRAVEDAQLDGQLNSRSEALAFIRGRHARGR